MAWQQGSASVDVADDTTTTAGREEPDEPLAGEPPASEPPAPPARVAGAGPAFALIVLTLALGLALWAPWEAAEPARLSTFAGRAGPETAVPAAPLPGPIAAATVTLNGPSAPPATATTASPPDPSRPAGMPLRRTDWLIVRDFAANGGPGPNGAVDIGVQNARDALGTPVYATHEGRVRVLRQNPRYGNLVAVKNSRWSTTYGHLDQVLVGDGQWVRRGDQIGTVGATGKVTGPVLDYQVWEAVNGQEVNRNPMDYLVAR